MTKPIIVGLLGLGTVGGGVFQILGRNAAGITHQLARPVVVKRILVRNPNKPRPVAVDRSILTTDFADILEDPEIDVVVETIGGCEPAFGYVMEAMARGKHVVTANKEMIAKCGRELLAQAERNNVLFRFEAAVAGGIPIIHALKESLVANRVQSVMGIINGTTNFILTEMTRNSQDFKTALADAQAAGYAEADPSADVDGLDAAYKLSILASIAFSSRVAIDDVYVEGIRHIGATDIKYADELGYVIKLLAIGKDDGERVSVRVHPTFVPKSHPLAAVSGVYNAIFVRGDAVGDLMFYGRGAGDEPTGSAVVADLVDIGRNLANTSPVRNCTCYYEKPVSPMSQTFARYYVRMEVKDEPGVLAQIATAFGASGVSLASVIQKGHGTEPVTLVFITHGVFESQLQEALSAIRVLPAVFEISSLIRVEV